ncbi:MAG: M28 family peptidase [bacterium]
MKTRLPFLAALSAITACASGSAPSPVAATSAAITTEDLRHRLFLIADDSMMGRESGSEGDFKAAAYVAAEFRRLGLEPAGDNGTYFQTVPFWNAAIDPTSHLEAGTNALQVGRDFVPAGIGVQPQTLNGVPTIYGGPASDSGAWITAAQAAGKFVVLDLPPGTPMRGLAIGSARWREVKGLAIVSLDVMGAETIARLREGRPVPDTTRNPRATPVLWITRRAATTIFGNNPTALSVGASGAPLTGRFDIARTPVPFPARNVVAILRGSDPALRGQYVALTAHNDHVGFDHFPVDHDSLRAFNRVIRPMGADSPVRQPTADEWAKIRTILDSLRRVNRPRLDSIRNGADDDGSGTVSILEIAEAMSRSGARPKRSILFVNHTGEEAGLLGSKWYSDHATVPIDSIVAEIDQDMVGRGTSTDFPRDGTGAGSATYLEVVGAKRLSREFGDSLEAANAREPVPFVFDYSYDAPGHPLQYYCRADHYSYARYGIPSVAMARGEHLDYHQVTDEAQYISYPDLARVSRMVYSAAMVIANMPHRPKLDAAKQTDPTAQCRQ